MDTTRLIAFFLAVALLPIAGMAQGQSHDHEAVRQEDGSIAITVTAKSKRLRSVSNSFTMDLTSLLEQAAAQECGGEFDLKQDPKPETEVKGDRLVAKLRGVARCLPAPDPTAGN